MMTWDSVAYCLNSALRTLADFVRDPRKGIGFDNGNSGTLDKAAPMGAALPDASAPLRSTLA